MASMVKLTPRAIAKAEELAKARGDGARHLRVYLEGKGCSGFYYGVAFDDPAPDDHRFPQGEVEIIVDPDTLDFVRGSGIDWIDDERGTGFLVTNPAHKRYRGKFFHKSFWQEQLASKLTERKKPCGSAK